MQIFTKIELKGPAINPYVMKHWSCGVCENLIASDFIVEIESGYGLYTFSKSL